MSTVGRWNHALILRNMIASPFNRQAHRHGMSTPWPGRAPQAAPGSRDLGLAAAVGIDCAGQVDHHEGGHRWLLAGEVLFPTAGASRVALSGLWPFAVRPRTAFYWIRTATSQGGRSCAAGTRAIRSLP